MNPLRMNESKKIKDKNQTPAVIDLELQIAEELDLQFNEGDNLNLGFGAIGNLGVSSDYQTLVNKPKINGTTLEGNYNIPNISDEEIEKIWNDVQYLVENEAYLSQVGLKTYTGKIKEAMDNKTSMSEGTVDYWKEHKLYTPKRNEVVIYLDAGGIDTDTQKPIPKIKIGDGLAYVSDLPFVDEDLTKQIKSHVENEDIHVSTEDRLNWDSKVDCKLEDDNLIFFR